ncbi:MAG: WecB/TagA/CpsF family glycosyltransferase [Phycisphaerales bacterium]|nr:WecB/TagA/CpsF family glycosyltransferase [Phycisphaerales bacterium]
MNGVLARVEQALHRHERLAISVVNVAKLVNMRKDSVLRDCVESGDLVLADGMPLVWLSRLKRQPLPERVAGIDLMYRLFDLANRGGFRVYFLGARREILDRVVEIACERYPRMVVAGHRDGYFSEDQHEEVAGAIRASRADILLVAMSSPKKELFMKRWGDFLDVPVTHGVGGSFDVLAGVTRRAPKWMQHCGLEWLYRVIQEPRRMWKRYLMTNTRFVWMFVSEMVRSSPRGTI